MEALGAVQLTCSNCGGGTDTATLVAAIASILVALATFWVAFTTRSAAKAAEAEAAATLQSARATAASARATVRSALATEGLLAAQLEPRLIEVQPPLSPPPDVERARFGESFELSDVRVGDVVMRVLTREGPEQITALGSVPVRNVGAGLAEIVGIALDEPGSTSSDSPQGFHPNWRCSKHFVPSGETARISFWFAEREHILGPTAQERAAGEAFSARVRRRDYLLVRVIYARRPESGRELYTTFVVHQVADGWQIGDASFSDL